MTKPTGLKKLNSIITFNLFVVLISGLGFSYSILLSGEAEPKIKIQSSPNILKYSTDGKCFDSDGGIANRSIYINGKVEFFEDPENMIVYKDYCVDSNTKLVESFCEFDNEENKVKVKSIVYTCEHTCEAGACIRN